MSPTQPNQGDPTTMIPAIRMYRRAQHLDQCNDLRPAWTFNFPSLDEDDLQLHFAYQELDGSWTILI